jgi:tRNA (cytidine56-2'-O)-methyltransferase
MIAILRIGHRLYRDKRITTHVALVARAFCADKIFIDQKDKNIENNIKSICNRFGGDFEIITGVDRKNILKNWEGNIVHLTMYGENLDKSIKKIDKKKNLLIIIGSEKVPPELYQIADYNISIGNQPHSEVAALSIFLDRYTDGEWIKRRYDGNIKIIPKNKGKKVIIKN